MFNHPYMMEKLMQFDAERLDRSQRYERPAPLHGGNSILMAIGKALRRAGEGMESWAEGDGGPTPTRRDVSFPSRKHY